MVTISSAVIPLDLRRDYTNIGMRVLPSEAVWMRGCLWVTNSYSCHPHPEGLWFLMMLRNCRKPGWFFFGDESLRFLFLEPDGEGNELFWGRRD